MNILAIREGFSAIRLGVTLSSRMFWLPAKIPAWTPYRFWEDTSEYPRAEVLACLLRRD